jgi:hypothetical protein
MAWYIKYGMGGGYGGADNTDWEEVDVDNQADAENWAYEEACNEFESSGEFDYDAFHEENPDASDEDEWEEYCQERESWIFYLAQEFDTNPNEY